MKLLRWLQLILVMLLLAACSKSGKGPGGALFGPSATLPSPSVGVTHAPDARAAMTSFLQALDKNDFASMYAMLSKATQDALPQDAFAAKYNDALNTMGASKLDFQILSQLLSPSAAQVGFHMIYHTAR